MPHTISLDYLRYLTSYEHSMWDMINNAMQWLVLLQQVSSKYNLLSGALETSLKIHHELSSSFKFVLYFEKYMYCEIYVYQK
jgi:hypothetical protein